MKKTNKGRNLIVIIFLIVLMTFLFANGGAIQEMITQTKAKEREEVIRDEKQKNKQLTVQVENLNEQVSDLENQVTELTDPNENNADQEEKNQELLKDFTEKWTNFSSIEDRNASVKELLSNEAIEENGINADLNVEFKSEGTIKKIAKVNSQDQQSYIVIADEEARGQKSTMLIEAEIEQEQIENFKARYVDTEYEE
ncbi:hypothetical protein GCM10025886_14210 [Tetragenococcus halophilus subsp. flandriensis]|uniref:EF0163 family protein n=1 Tax=Tetragenococcus halophilus TaxID=51669 RepID=UPI0023E9801F|nr:EF0163 family protein [Tetragenococcus halophilus]GMA08270.1 hypothetical protein GCM10025886_14210 [Tetragenococcus halophilus subsp. flandriensis]